MLSIIIPTKNRVKYALNVIETIINRYSRYDFELVVCDNSDDDELEKFILEINDNKIKYKHIKESLSFVDNFSMAVSMATGDYLTIIGDDDIVCDNIFTLVKWMKKKHIECVKFNMNLSYFWPNVLKGKSANGELTLRNFHYKIRSVDPQKGLIKMLKKGFYDYQEYDIPRLYHGVVKRELLDRIYSISNKYFYGLSPDIYIAVALAFVSKKLYIVNEPFTLSGVCKKSGSADSISGKHTGDLKDAPHFKGHQNYIWNSNVPYVYSVHTIWAETVFQAISSMKRNDFLKYYSPKKLYIYLYNHYPMFKKILREEYKNKYKKNLNLFSTFIYGKIFSVKRFIKNGFLFLYRKITGRFVYYNMKSISDAIDITNNYLLNKKGIRNEK